MDGDSKLILEIRSRPDLILLDLDFSDKSAFLLCRYIRTFCPGSRILSLVQRDKAQALYAGEDAILAKPFKADELIRKIQLLIPGF